MAINLVVNFYFQRHMAKDMETLVVRLVVSILEEEFVVLHDTDYD